MLVIGFFKVSASSLMMTETYDDVVMRLNIVNLTFDFYRFVLFKRLNHRPNLPNYPYSDIPYTSFLGN